MGHSFATTQVTPALPLFPTMGTPPHSYPILPWGHNSSLVSRAFFFPPPSNAVHPILLIPPPNPFTPLNQDYIPVAPSW